MLVEARLEKIDCVKRALGIGEELLVFFGGGWRRIFARRRKLSRRVSSREMQLVERDQDSLGEVERSMLRRRDRDHDVRAIENFIRKSLVFPSEENRDRTLPRELQ